MLKVKSKSVLQAFILANELKNECYKKDSVLQCERSLSEIKNRILAYSEEELWQLITDDHRVDRYKNCEWYFGEIKLSDTGVWPHMGKIPNELLYKDTVDASRRVFDALETLPEKKREQLSSIAPLSEFLNEHLPIIVIENGHIRDRENYEKMRYDIDDGNHRAIYLASQGGFYVNAYVGRTK